MWDSSPDSSAWWMPSASYGAPPDLWEGGASRETHLLADLAQLRLEVLPLAHPQVVEELPLAHPPERARAQLALLFADVAPEVEPGQEVTSLGLEPRVLLVGLGLEVGRSLPGVLQAQGRGDHDDLTQAAEPIGLQDHPGQPRVDRQPRQPPPELGESRRQRAELLEQLDAGRDVALVGRVEEREPGQVSEAEGGHLKDHAGQVGAKDLRLGELGASFEVLLGIEPDRDPGLHPSASTGPLVGAGLADRLDRQALDLGPCGVTADPGHTGVHDVPDAGHGERSLGDVCREHDPAPGVAFEHLVLLGGGQPRVQGYDLQPRPAIELVEITERVRGVTDLPLTGQEDEDVAWALRRELAYGVHDRLGLVPDDWLALLVLFGQGDERPVANLDRVGAAGDLDDRRGLAAPIREVGGEPLRVDGRRGDDDLEVRPFRQQPFEVAKDEVHVEAALVGLVDDQGVVAAQHPVSLKLGEQDAVGHQLDPAGLRGPVGEPDLIADDIAQCGLQLLGDPFGD